MSDSNGVTGQAEEVESQAAQEEAPNEPVESGEFSRQLRERADDVRKTVVKQLHNAAEKIRDDVREADVGDDAAESRADNIADGLEKAAHYLNSRSVEELGQDAGAAIRRRTSWKLVAVIFIVGLVAGLLLRGDADSE